ncbi:MAG: YdbL family protein [Candidatus Omnitrophica bacterium]|nr:YdbL family protein [Candidatus Omnitrophota bacterium]MCF7877663.1 YdbL family protein [Candidatus Omnitrophota bacterium]MCF7878485.1 YdbL family protein [Candidatus Omnitrophota bacterium]MCF7893347.1 YdbL family protein [Candidatus Omnitrophota bacterium]
MKKLGVILVMVVFAGCAKLSVETEKPIKVDINMRLDVYQHVVKEADSIESRIYGNNQPEMNSIFTIGAVYAADNREDAIRRRKQRAAEIENYFDQGYIGENRRGYLSLLKNNLPSQVEEVVAEENKDRKIIYKNTAEKNDAKFSAVEKIFFKDHYNRAPSGWYFEIYDQNEGKYIWQKK